MPDPESDEKYIVLIFENGLGMNEHMILEGILSEIGKNNNLTGFLCKLHFDEANARLVNFNKASKQKEEKVSVKGEQRSLQIPHERPPPLLLQVKPAQTPPKGTQAASMSPGSMQLRTRMATRQQTSSYFEDEDEDMTDLQPTFSGPVIKWVT